MSASFGLPLDLEACHRALVAERKESDQLREERNEAGREIKQLKEQIDRDLALYREATRLRDEIITKDTARIAVLEKQLVDAYGLLLKKAIEVHDELLVKALREAIFR